MPRDHDPDEWGPLSPPDPPRRGLPVTVTVRFGEDDAALLRAELKRVRGTYPELVRRLVREALRAPKDDVYNRVPL